MPELLTPDLCVIGAGPGGLVVAAGAAQLGAAVVLIEAGPMGGDCLNVGCVPSKTLLAIAHAVHQAGRAAAWGITLGPPQVDYARVRQRIREVVAAIAPNDSVERFEGMGVRVIAAEGRFVAPDEVVAGGTRVRARRFVVATGARPAVPPIPGLAALPFLTNENVFELDRLPGHLGVIGGGPIGVELAQAFRRLGAAVTIFEATTLLGREDPELVELLRQRLAAEGVALREGAGVSGIGHDGADFTVGNGADAVRCSDLLVAAGRRPAVDGLGLEAAGIAFGPRGISIDAGLRTSNRRVYAIGDVAGGQHTHTAGHQASLVLRSALFRLPVNAGRAALPAVVYTDPELARVGLTAAEAAARGPIRLLRWPLADNDRAQAEGEPHGLVKVVTDRRGRVLGAAVLAPRAGEIIQPWILAVEGRLKLRHLAAMVAPYPTFGEVTKRTAASHFLPRLLGSPLRRLIPLLARLG